MKLTLFVLVSFLISLSTQAYTVRGNGGFLVACQKMPTSSNHSTIDVWVLDVYEGQKKLGLPLHYSTESKMDLRLGEYFARAEKLQLASKSTLLQIWQYMKENIQFANLGFAKIDDLGAAQYKPCSLVLGALQRVQTVSENGSITSKLLYKIDPEFWKIHLDENQKAVLLLHEVLYTNYMNSLPSSVAATVTSEVVRIQVYKILTSL
jgi:hypothetical protein